MIILYHNFFFFILDFVKNNQDGRDNHKQDGIPFKDGTIVEKGTNAVLKDTKDAVKPEDQNNNSVMSEENISITTEDELRTHTSDIMGGIIERSQTRLERSLDNPLSSYCSSSSSSRSSYSSVTSSVSSRSVSPDNNSELRDTTSNLTDDHKTVKELNSNVTGMPSDKETVDDNTNPVIPLKTENINLSQNQASEIDIPLISSNNDKGTKIITSDKTTKTETHSNKPSANIDIESKQEIKPPCNEGRDNDTHTDTPHNTAEDVKSDVVENASSCEIIKDDPQSSGDEFEVQYESPVPDDEEGKQYS